MNVERRQAAADPRPSQTTQAVSPPVVLMAGDDDEVYDKKPQRYAEDNSAALNCTQC